MSLPTRQVCSCGQKRNYAGLSVVYQLTGSATLLLAGHGAAVAWCCLGSRRTSRLPEPPPRFEPSYSALPLDALMMGHHFSISAA
jgi:hypothetical protein